ncbi:hypothetical protein [Planococcus ruber]|uniref:hypothetical protein n=1 Tax=Planococcus ruber TaxID=2027871 RepID=UPI001FEDB042|nr:hypothetical protein [Planococcus ruber]MCJ1908956.1 hypothetical protein [Planococcus ruber]
MRKNLQRTGYQVIEGKGSYRHLFGGQSIESLPCPTCGLQVQLLLTFDLTDPIFENLGTDIPNLPLVSCLNCSGCWSTQFYKIEEKRIRNLEQDDEEKWVMEQEDKLPVPLPEVEVHLMPLSKKGILSKRSSDEKRNEVFDELGLLYVARLFGGELTDGEEEEFICRFCKGKMDYIASIGEDATEGELITVVPFLFGEMVLNFYFCRHCNTIRVEPIAT